MAASSQGGQTARSPRYMVGKFARAPLPTNCAATGEFAHPTPGARCFDDALPVARMKRRGWARICGVSRGMTYDSWHDESSLQVRPEPGSTELFAAFD